MAARFPSHLRPGHRSGRRLAAGFAFAAVALTALGAAAADLPLLADLLAQPAYRKPLASVLPHRGLPPWIGRFLKTGAGVGNPGSTVVADGKSFELYTVCEPHDCEGNFLVVLYPPSGGQAWAVITRGGKTLAYLGRPTADQRKALIAATRPAT